MERNIKDELDNAIKDYGTFRVLLNKHRNEYDVNDWKKHEQDCWNKVQRLIKELTEETNLKAYNRYARGI